MRKNDIVKTDQGVFRILTVDEDQVLAIDCEKKTMPQFFPVSFFENREILKEISSFLPWEELSPNERKIAQKRYTMIAAAVAVVNDKQKRNSMIDYASQQFSVSKQTLRYFLCTYLIYQDIAVLAPKKKEEKALTQDQKNIRWALNKFFYTRNQNSLSTAYTMMLKEKYCDPAGNLLSNYPSFNQFRYFYRKHKKIENFCISRDGLTAYQRNSRPLVGDGVQEFAPVIGTAMLDSTICDIYLVNEKRELAGRPILTVACDANSSVCMGYVLSWENDTASLKNLMLNILEDKVSFCEKRGIHIDTEQWNVKNQLPSILITDQGHEYTGQTFEQIAELGITLINLPPYRPESKGPIEKLFDLIQNSYKDILKGSGVIMPDFAERGAHDYRKDAVLTLQEFERIVIRCIIHYNCERVLQNYPYDLEMLGAQIPPYANKIWNWKKENAEANLIDVSQKDLILTLLPRANGKFTRKGLLCNHLRYYADGYKEQFLRGGDVIVSYDPENCNHVWIKESDGSFVKFTLIEKRFSNMSLDEIQNIQKQQKQLIQKTAQDQYQSKIDLMNFIETVAETASEKKKH
jgi:transposase InsO family protein